jgi:hypothetical protein
MPVNGTSPKVEIVTFTGFSIASQLLGAVPPAGMLIVRLLPVPVTLAKAAASAGFVAIINISFVKSATSLYLGKFTVHALPLRVIVVPSGALDANVMPVTVAGVAWCGSEGVTELEAAEAALVPTAFVAVTVNVYAVPFVKPVTVIGLDVPVAIMLPGFDVTVKPVISLPPSFAGGVNDTVAWVLPAVATTAVGTPGAVAFTVTDTVCTALA